MSFLETINSNVPQNNTIPYDEALELPYTTKSSSASTGKGGYSIDGPANLRSGQYPKTWASRLLIQPTITPPMAVAYSKNYLLDFNFNLKTWFNMSGMTDPHNGGQLDSFMFADTNPLGVATDKVTVPLPGSKVGQQALLYNVNMRTLRPMACIPYDAPSHLKGMINDQFFSGTDWNTLTPMNLRHTKLAQEDIPYMPSLYPFFSAERSEAETVAAYVATGAPDEFRLNSPVRVAVCWAEGPWAFFPEGPPALADGVAPVFGNPVYMPTYTIEGSQYASRAWIVNSKLLEVTQTPLKVAVWASALHTYALETYVYGSCNAVGQLKRTMDCTIQFIQIAQRQATELRRHAPTYGHLASWRELPFGTRVTALRKAPVLDRLHALNVVDAPLFPYYHPQAQSEVGFPSDLSLTNLSTNTTIRVKLKRELGAAAEQLAGSAVLRGLAMMVQNACSQVADADFYQAVDSIVSRIRCVNIGKDKPKAEVYEIKKLQTKIRTIVAMPSWLQSPLQILLKYIMDPGLQHIYEDGNMHSLEIGGLPPVAKGLFHNFFSSTLDLGRVKPHTVYYSDNMFLSYKGHFFSLDGVKWESQATPGMMFGILNRLFMDGGHPFSSVTPNANAARTSYAWAAVYTAAGICPVSCLGTFNHVVPGTASGTYMTFTFNHLRMAAYHSALTLSDNNANLMDYLRRGLSNTLENDDPLECSFPGNVAFVDSDIAQLMPQSSLPKDPLAKYVQLPDLEAAILGGPWLYSGELSRVDLLGFDVTMIDVNGTREFFPVLAYDRVVKAFTFNKNGERKFNPGLTSESAKQSNEALAHIEDSMLFLSKITSLAVAGSWAYPTLYKAMRLALIDRMARALDAGRSLVQSTEMDQSLNALVDGIILAATNDNNSEVFELEDEETLRSAIRTFFSLIKNASQGIMGPGLGPIRFLSQLVDQYYDPSNMMRIARGDPRQVTFTSCIVRNDYLRDLYSQSFRANGLTDADAQEYLNTYFDSGDDPNAFMMISAYQDDRGAVERAVNQVITGNTRKVPARPRDEDLYADDSLDSYTEPIRPAEPRKPI